MYRLWNFLTQYSLLLLIGALLALLWANTNPQNYRAFVDFVIWEDGWIGHEHHGHRTLTLHYLVNDLCMAFFFAIAAKEVWEAVILRDGALRGRRALAPLFATAGGMLGPVAIYLGVAALLGSDTYQAVANGWAIPTATDIAFSYLIGRVVFGEGHPAVRFLLLLAIADDALGLLILAVFYPSAEQVPLWLLVSLAAAIVVFVLFNWLPRRLDRGKQHRPFSTLVRRRLHCLPYVVAGCISWYAFMRSGLHPALGLLPVIPAIPHADRAFGVFASAQQHLSDLLNVMEHALKHPVEVVLFLFGLLNAGVEFSTAGVATWLVLAGLLVGKPVGIFLFGWIAVGPLRLGLAPGMRLVDLVVIGFVAAIGFTVSLFVSSVAFEPGPMQDAAKMGALLSFSAAIVSIIAGRVLRVEKRTL